MLKSKGLLKKASFMLIVICLIVVCLSVYVEAAACEDGLVRCMHDPINNITFGGSIYCGIGYLFCMKYLR